MPRNPKCQDCVLHRSSKNKCIWGHGNADQGFLVGEAPGKAEASTGKPFQGESGQLLRGLLADVGMPEPYITNVAKCRPPQNRKPEPDEINACRPYLEEEIENENPKAILLMGATAMKAMIGKTKITEMNGQVVEKNGRKYVCSFHPAYILRDPSKEGELKKAIQRYKDVLEDKFSDELPDYTIIQNTTLEIFLQDWAACSAFSFDTETTGLEWWKTKIHCLQMSLRVDDKIKNWILPVFLKPVMPEEICQDFLSYLTKTQGKKKCYAQNGKYDNLMLMSNFGVRFRVDFDIGLASHILDENTSNSLKNMARSELGAPDYDIPLKDKIAPRASKNPNATIKRLFAYGAADSNYTLRIGEKFTKRFDDEERWLFNKLVMRAARAFVDIERNGMYVDTVMMDRVSREQSEELIKIRGKLNEMAGREINWNAPAQVAEVLYKDLGLTPTIVTAKGNPSTGESALVDIKHPIARTIEEYRKVEKFLSTYCGYYNPETNTYEGGLREYMDGPHCYLSFKLHGTVTGRFSSRLHQVPRDGTIRNIFIAPPGWEFVQMDLSQAELRVIAIVAEDPEMLRIFRSGGDIHWNTLCNVIETARGGKYLDSVLSTAKQLTKRKNKELDFSYALELVREAGHEKCETIWKGWKEGRKHAKGINFGFPYSQSAEGFLTYAKNTFGFEPTLEEATQFREVFFNSFRRLPHWHERQKKLVRQDGFVRNLLGRKRHLPGIYSSEKHVVAEAERQAINSPIQGYIGDHKAAILIDVHENIPHDRFRVVGEVHDSILGWVKSEYKDKTLRQVKHLADNPSIIREAGLTFPIPLTVDIEVGRWGAGERWNP